MHKKPKKRVSKIHRSKFPKADLEMASKSTIVINPLQPPIVDVEHTPLANVDYKITDPVIEFNLLDLHCWSLEKSLDQGDEVQIWESSLSKYVVPHTHQCLEVIRLC